VNVLRWVKVDGSTSIIQAVHEGRTYVVARSGAGGRLWSTTIDGVSYSVTPTKTEATAAAEFHAANHTQRPAAVPQPKLGEVVDALAPNELRDWLTVNVFPVPEIEFRRRRTQAVDNLAILQKLGDAINDLMTGEVRLARAQDPDTRYDYNQPTWSQIGEALGMTKQGAASKYAKRIEEAS
jgi:hypothetical protein